MQDPWVGELSEGEILSAILRELGPSAAEVGPGDDAAVLTASDGRVVATVDTLVHGPDFRLAWSSGFDLGWKAAAVNLADIAAMGARPTSLLVALAMPDATRLSFEQPDSIRLFSDRLHECRPYPAKIEPSAKSNLATDFGSLALGQPPSSSYTR